ncbi:hypothetical protein BJX68DRAFT_136264 [Aspergillus pseudodeflectus]|uniref:F-box domain-containing protein n=1 Tax=Aspergillus pseudodeflectus TaxID=176178 RepID=A0ABR4JYK5_9EURO
MATPIKTPTPAIQKALSLPEILSEIFHWIYADEGRLEEIPDRPRHYTFVITRRNDLHSCALTSRLWFAQSIALLWKIPHDPDLKHLERDIEDRIGPLPPSRREFYAKFIDEGTIETTRLGKDGSKSELDGVVLPALRTLRLYVPVYNSGVPAIVAPRLKQLDIDPHVEVLPPEECVGENVMGEVLEQIPALFPNVDVVTFGLCYARRKDFERFKSRMPGVTIHDEDSIIMN